MGRHHRRQSSCSSLPIFYPQSITCLLFSFAALPSVLFAADDSIRPILERHCLECHSGEEPKGELRLDQLAVDFSDEAIRKQWRAVLNRLTSGEMPPKEKPRPPAQDIQTLTEWINGQIDDAEAAQRVAQGRVVLRRLNRVEYKNTVQDLLGVDVDLKELLPLDSSADGFDNVGEALHVSSFLMERYLEAADTALNVAIVNGPKPPSERKRYSYKDERAIIGDREEFAADGHTIFRQLDDAVVFFSSTYSPTVLGWFYPQIRGQYRFRISAYGFQSPDKPVTFQVQAGGLGMAGTSHLVGYFDAPPDKPTVFEFVDRMEPTNTIHIVPYGTGREQEVRKEGAEKYQGAGLAVQWVDVEGPLNDTWPPESHRRIFGDLPQAPAPLDNNHPDRVEVVSEVPMADADRILRLFARRAFRRPVTDDDLKPFMAIVEARLAENYSFERAVRVGLASVLVSPEFLFLREAPGKLDDFALASRLSYFLWSSMPDEELLAFAEQQKLDQPDTLHAQVERLLQDPKAAAFTKNFVGQWLGLRNIDFTEPSFILYPEFDDMLKHSMVRESEMFFAEVLKNDLSLMNFVASDFTMLNGRLAKHYGISGVDGWEFRKMPLPADSHRGGVLTMASVLKVTANGTSTSPVTRGAWVLERILGTPPPRPPENVALEPDIRGATTIREQLAKHRQVATCASCHSRIDPPGFALESFDVIGGWRENYRSSGNGKPVTRDGRQMPYLEGPAIDPADVLPDGRAFRNIDELKQLLMEDKDQIARALTIKLLTYATGGAPAAADQPQVDAIVAKVREKNFGFRTLIHEIVASELFRNK